MRVAAPLRMRRKRKDLIDLGNWACIVLTFRLSHSAAEASHGFLVTSRARGAAHCGEVVERRPKPGARPARHALPPHFPSPSPLRGFSGLRMRLSSGRVVVFDDPARNLLWAQDTSRNIGKG